VTILFTGERGLEVCGNGARSPLSMDIYTSRPGRNSWHHTTSTDSLWWSHSNWCSPIWDCFHNSQTPYIHQPLNTTIFVLSMHKYHREAWRDCGYGAENDMLQTVVFLNQNNGNILRLLFLSFFFKQKSRIGLSLFQHGWNRPYVQKWMA
jgi:hypothetical protein